MVCNRLVSSRKIWLLLIIFVYLIVGSGCIPKHYSELQVDDFEVVDDTAYSIDARTPEISDLVPTKINTVAPPLILQQPTPIAPTLISYDHPDNLFYLQYPADWEVHKEGQGIDFIDLENSNRIHSFVVNTGQSLDGDSFDRLIDARERNVFSGLDGYLSFEKNSLESDSISLEKQVIDQGTSFYVNSCYKKIGNRILVLDFWSPWDLHGTFKNLFVDIFLSSSVGDNLGQADGFYGGEVQYSDEYFSMSFPEFWTFKQSMTDNAMVTTVLSPDEEALVQIMVYDDDEFLSQGITGEIVLKLLNENYAKDIWVDEYSVISEGKEQLRWNSNEGGYVGFTVFETRDSAMVMITSILDQEQSGFYDPIVQQILSSFSITR